MDSKILIILLSHSVSVLPSVKTADLYNTAFILSVCHNSFHIFIYYDVPVRASQYSVYNTVYGNATGIKKECSVAQLVVRWLAGRQARVRISARHPIEIPPTEPTAVKTYMWAWANVYE